MESIWKGYKVGPYKRYKWGEMGPLQMAENKWVTGVITLLTGLKALHFCMGFWGSKGCSRNDLSRSCLYS